MKLLTLEKLELGAKTMMIIDDDDDDPLSVPNSSLEGQPKT